MATYDVKETPIELKSQPKGLVHKIQHYFTQPKVIKRFNGYAVLLWLVLVVPTVAIWSKSVLWVAMLSIWANVISHYTAWLAARVEVREEQVEINMEEKAAQDVRMADQAPGASK